jgi:hypothetical protein
MGIPTPDRLRGWGWERRRRLVVVAAVLALGVTGTEAATASGALASPDRSGDRAADAQAATGPSATAIGTLTALPYSFPAGSGGSLTRPLGISAFQGHVYVSNTPDNVVSDLNGGNTTTIAGSLEGTGENGDGGPANLATLSQPTGTAEDSAGDIYIADTEDNVVRKIDAATGIITRFAGTDKAGAALRPRPGWTPRRRWRSTRPGTCSSPTPSTTGSMRSCRTGTCSPSPGTARQGMPGTAALRSRRS